MYVKICGLTSVGDAQAVASAGADAVGLNFYQPSKRFVGRAVVQQSTSGDSLGRNNKDAVADQSTLQLARHIRDSVSDQLDVVGVFVNSSSSDVSRVAIHAGLDAVQFHGDETPELIAEFHQSCPTIHIIRAFRIGSPEDGSTHRMDDDLSQLTQLHVPIAAVLVDALVAGEYGGTGHQVQADVVKRWITTHDNRYRLILAGGLTPENVDHVAADVVPWGVDTASGVESAPGIKEVGRVKRFVNAVRGVATTPTGRL